MAMVSSISGKTAECDFYRAAAFEALPQGALIANNKGVIVALNRAMIRRLSELGAGTVENGDMLPDVFHYTHDQIVRRLKLAVSVPRVTLRLAQSTGAPQEICICVTALKTNGAESIDFLLTETDAARVVQQFSSLTRKLDDANTAKVKLARKLDNLGEDYQALERFSYCTAHDLKAPLRNISDILAFLKADDSNRLSQTGMKDLTTASECAQRLDRLVTNLLALARSGSISLKTERVCLASTLAQVSKIFATELTALNGGIDVEGDLGYIVADKALIHLLLENLIGNAIKYRSPTRAPVIIV